jgi:threonine synthase
MLHSHTRLSDDDAFVEMVLRLDGRVAEVDGRGFKPTPFGRSASLSDALGFSEQGGLWVKDETGNVAGSHKARHLMGVMLHIEVAERLGLSDRRPDLAVASCGNAALAAAIVARAAGRQLRVFVPVDADTTVVNAITDLGADVTVCPREPQSAGDPTVGRLAAALAGGSLAFTCQGNLNGLSIEGGETLAYEMISEQVPLDDLFIQVGGGALASACIAAWREAAALGMVTKLPRIHAVQTQAAHPLDHAFRQLRDDRRAGAEQASRSRYMQPWPQPGRSIAAGILDDETYDWRVVVDGMLESGGESVIVSEAALLEAHAAARRAGFTVDATGTAGLAGVLDRRARGTVAPDDRVAVLFTGADRDGEPKTT